MSLHEECSSRKCCLSLSSLSCMESGLAVSVAWKGTCLSLSKHGSGVMFAWELAFGYGVFLMSKAFLSFLLMS